MLSKYDVDDEENFGKVFAVRVPFAVSSQSSWIWANALHKHLNAREIFCLDSQMTSAVYDNPHDSSSSSERYPLLRMLATSSVVSDAATGGDGKGAYPVRTLEVPRFTTGIPAALLTLVRAAVGALYECPWGVT